MYPGLPTTDIFKGDCARVCGALGGCPSNALVRHLFQDLGLPLTAYTGDLGNPFQAVITELRDALDTTHELRKVLKLRPLVVCRAYRHIDHHRFLDLRRHDIPSPGLHGSAANQRMQRWHE